MNFIDVHTHSIKSISGITSIYNTYPSSKTPNTPFSIGIHPWHIEPQNLTKDFEKVKSKLLEKNCIAIGECGLDKLTTVDFNTQLTVFKKHIALSENYKKPLIIHCVRAYNELVTIKKEVKPLQPWIVHGFHKNSQIANELIKNKIHFSIGSTLLRNEKLQQVCKEIATENIFLETDDSEESILNIYNTFATIKNESLESIKTQINQNFNRIFTL